MTAYKLVKTHMVFAVYSLHAKPELFGMRATESKQLRGDTPKVVVTDMAYRFNSKKHDIFIIFHDMP